MNMSLPILTFHRILIFLVLITCFACNENNSNGTKESSTPKSNNSEQEIVDPKLREKAVTGNWEISGGSLGINGLKVELDGEFEYKESKLFTGIMSYIITGRPNKRIIIACETNGKWNYDEELLIDIDYEYEGKCNCTYKVNANVTEEQLTEIKEEMKVCEDGIFLLSESSRKSSDITTNKVKVYKDKIIQYSKNYSNNIEYEMIMTRIK